MAKMAFDSPGGDIIILSKRRSADRKIQRLCKLLAWGMSAAKGWRYVALDLTDPVSDLNLCLRLWDGLDDDHMTAEAHY
jgi:hypothetical protein